MTIADSATQQRTWGCGAILFSVARWLNKHGMETSILQQCRSLPIFGLAFFRGGFPLPSRTHPSHPSPCLPALADRFWVLSFVAPDRRKPCRDSEKTSASKEFETATHQRDAKRPVMGNCIGGKELPGGSFAVKHKTRSYIERKSIKREAANCRAQLHE